MDKSNVFKSSDFHMDTGDILHMIIIDETGTALTADLQVTHDTGVVVSEAPGQAVCNAATDITSTSFTANWYLMGNTTGYYLDVATDISFTSYVSGYQDVDVGGALSYSVTGLSDLTNYYYRVRAYNDIGTGESSETEIATTSLEAITDIDGNVYTYVTIGTQQWLVENLKTTKYADGTAIDVAASDVEWAANSTGIYSAYDYNASNGVTYGLLYSGYALTNAHGLIYFETDGTPDASWRLPSNADYQQLSDYYGGNLVAGEMLKSPPFVMLAGGYRRTVHNPDCINLGLYGRVWSSDFSAQQSYWTVLFESGHSEFTNSYDGLSSGLSIRCVRDL